LFQSYGSRVADLGIGVADRFDKGRFRLFGRWPQSPERPGCAATDRRVRIAKHVDQSDDRLTADPP
jgi:hypothetical protein